MAKSQQGSADPSLDEIKAAVAADGYHGPAAAAETVRRMRQIICDREAAQRKEAS